MSVKTLFIALSCLLLAACDRPSAPDAVPPSQVQSTPAAPDRAELAARYAGRPLTILDISEIQQDGAATLAVTVSAPLDPQQNLADFLTVADQDGSKLDGAWQLADNLMTATLSPLPPKRRLTVRAAAGLRALGGTQLAHDASVELETRHAEPVVGFASSGSLLPTELLDGLPVMTLNVEQVDVDFFRIRTNQLQPLLEYGWHGALDIWDADQVAQMGDLVYSGRFKLGQRNNVRETVLLPLSGIDALKQPGVYVAIMKQAGTYRYALPATVFSLSDIGLSLRRYQDQMLVLTQALAGGKALSGVEVEVLDRQGKVLSQGKTDEAGMLTLPANEHASLVLARQQGQTTVLNLSTAALDLSEFKVDGPPSGSLNVFMFGPRDLYRPGETVPINALLRTADGRPVAAQPLEVKVFQPDGNQRLSFTWHAQTDGWYQRDLALPADAQTGLWRVSARTGNGDEQDYRFHVEDFLPERIAVLLDTPADWLTPEDDLDFGVDAQYLYGAPAGGNTVTGQIYINLLREAVPALPGYQFGDINETQWRQAIELPPMVLDEDGTTVVSQTSSWGAARSPLRATLQASVQESGGRPVTRRATADIWPAETLPGVRVLGADADGSVDADGLAEFEFVLSDREGQKLAGRELQVQLIRERRDYYWGYSADGGWSYRYDEKQFPVETRTVEIAAGQTLKLGFLLEWGPYRVEITDPQTGLMSNARVWAGYRWQDTSDGTGAIRPDQVGLTLDKPAYRAGEVAKVTVAAPVAGSGYLMVESAAGPLWWQAIDVPAAGKTFDIPIAADWDRHDLYISALVLRPGERQQVQTPKRAVGVLFLPLSRAERRLTVELQAPAQMRPERPLSTKVQVRDHAGQPVANTRVLVSAVDRGILNITEFQTPNPYDAFFGRKRYDVDQLDIYGRLIEGGHFRQASLAFGGDAATAPGGLPPLTTVQLVALQAQTVVTDAQGLAEVTLQIPDFNGELRVMAQAWTESDFGAADAATVVAAPLVAELAAPRFLAGGDRSTLALDLHNLSGQAQDLTLTVSYDGALSADAPSPGAQRIALANGAKQIVRLPVRATGGYGQGQVQVRVSGLKVPDDSETTLTRQWQIGVRPAVPAQSRNARAVVAPGQTSDALAMADIAGWQADGLQAVLELSSTPPLDVAQQIRELIAYPYGCVEQTVSGLYASLYLDEAALRRLGMSNQQSDADRRLAVETGVQRLLSMQRADGGFGLWSPDSPEAPWVTVYTADFLQRARAQGYAVPAGVMEQVNRKLLNYLNTGDVPQDLRSDDSNHARFAVQAYAAAVLARSKQAPLAGLRALYERRGVARSGLPLVQLGLALQAMGDEARAQQVLGEALKTDRPKDVWLNDYGSALRDRAAMLQWLLEADALADQRGGLLLQVAEDMRMRAWLSTQERAAVLLAAVQLDQSEQPRWTASWQAGDEQDSLSATRMRGIALPAAALRDAPLSLRNDGQSELYASLTVTGYPAKVPPPSNHGFTISRRYLDPQGQPVDLSQLRSGDLVLVALNIQAHRYVPDALVVDLLPAGLEIENQNLANAAASLEQAGAAVRALWQDALSVTLAHQEYRDDRYVAALPMYAEQRVTLLYLARAVTPGSYLVPPPFVESMYAPTVNGMGASPGMMVIRP